MGLYNFPFSSHQGDIYKFVFLKKRLKLGNENIIMVLPLHMHVGLIKSFHYIGGNELNIKKQTFDFGKKKSKFKNVKNKYELILFCLGG